jgi:hypothetical protein
MGGSQPTNLEEVNIMIVTSADDAIGVLIKHQVSQSGVPTQPAHGDTLETEAGWAFFNVNGYLGTVTEEGEVITEPGLVETD